MSEHRRRSPCCDQEAWRFLATSSEEIIRDYLTSPAAEKALAEAMLDSNDLDGYCFPFIETEAQDAASIILAALREKVK